MSYPAALLKQSIVRRLNGQCRVDILSGKALALDGDRLKDFASCAECHAPCENLAAGLCGSSLSMKVDQRPGHDATIRWDCPECGRETRETAPLLQVPDMAKQIEADPLCWSCRKSQ